MEVGPQERNNGTQSLTLPIGACYSEKSKGWGLCSCVKLHPSQEWLTQSVNTGWAKSSSWPIPAEILGGSHLNISGGPWPPPPRAKDWNPCETLNLILIGAALRSSGRTLVHACGTLKPYPVRVVGLLFMHVGH
jgi:hypothetical protein